MIRFAWTPPLSEARMCHRTVPSGRNDRGFTIVEMLVVVAMFALLASIALPMTEIAHQRSKEAELRHALRTLRDALDQYKAAVDTGRILRRADESGYPPNLETLVLGVTDATDPGRRKLYFLRRIPRDPFAPAEIAEPQDTWGKRSYQSDALTPKEGSDVYDVFSLSTRVGLNGQTYSKW